MEIVKRKNTAVQMILESVSMSVIHDVQCIFIYFFY